MLSLVYLSRLTEFIELSKVRNTHRKTVKETIPLRSLVKMWLFLKNSLSNPSNFVLPFQRFIMILTEHLVRCETEGTSVLTPWYKNCIERLQQIFLQVCGQLWLDNKHHYSQPQIFYFEKSLNLSGYSTCRPFNSCPFVPTVVH